MYIYGGDHINFDLNYEEQQTDKNSKEMRILVYKIEDYEYTVKVILQPPPLWERQFVFWGLVIFRPKFYRKTLENLQIFEVDCGYNMNFTVYVQNVVIKWN